MEIRGYFLIKSFEYASTTAFNLGFGNFSDEVTTTPKKWFALAFAIWFLAVYEKYQRTFTHSTPFFYLKAVWGSLDVIEMDITTKYVESGTKL